MVRYGFGLADVKQLYFDEMHAYFLELVSLLEREGILKEGTTDRVKDAGTADVKQLKKQLGSLFGSKPKSK